MYMWGVELFVYAFITPALDDGEWSGILAGLFTSQEGGSINIV